LHVVRKTLKSGSRFYVYAWRGGPQIHVQDGARPIVTNDILDKAREARMQGNGDYAGSFEVVIDEYLESPEFARLAEVTKDDYRRWLTRISVRFGRAPAASNHHGELQNPRGSIDVSTICAELVRLGWR